MRTVGNVTSGRQSGNRQEMAVRLDTGTEKSMKTAGGRPYGRQRQPAKGNQADGKRDPCKYIVLYNGSLLPLIHLCHGGIKPFGCIMAAAWPDGYIMPFDVRSGGGLLPFIRLIGTHGFRAYFCRKIGNLSARFCRDIWISSAGFCRSSVPVAYGYGHFIRIDAVHLRYCGLFGYSSVLFSSSFSVPAWTEQGFAVYYHVFFGFFPIGWQFVAGFAFFRACMSVFSAFFGWIDVKR